MVCPAAEKEVGDADLTTVMAGAWMAVMVAVGWGGDDGRARWRVTLGGGGVGDRPGVHVRGGGQVGGGAGLGRPGRQSEVRAADSGQARQVRVVDLH